MNLKIRFEKENGDYLDEHECTELAKVNIERLIISLKSDVNLYGDYCKIIVVINGQKYTDHEAAWDAVREWAKA